MVAFLILALALTACAASAPVTSVPATITLPPTARPVLNGPTPTPAPGLVVQGKVTFDGRPLVGVKIYRSYASYPGEVVATTGKDGTYRSEFMYIPGDEMVTVWAEMEGYTFKPEKEFWRHYHGYEERTADFKASRP
jgi:hypothetical protein